MTWSISNLVVQLIGGIVGAHVAATLAKEHNFGVVGHSLVGAIAGALSGHFLQITVGTVVDGGGTIGEATPVEQAILQAIAGVAIGAIAMLVVGFMQHAIGQHQPTKRQ